MQKKYLMAGNWTDKVTGKPVTGIVDEDAAAIVRRIFSMALDGCGVEQIAAALEQDKVLPPTYYWQSKQEELNAMITRDRELDTLFERLYEDNVSAKISDEQFSKMSTKYEAEQGELTERIKAVRAELEKETDKSMSTDMFISTIRKYTRAKELTPRMFNELIARIEVHQAEKIDGVYVQKLTIHYHCVGTIKIPDILPLRQPDISIETTKGWIIECPHLRMV